MLEFLGILYATPRIGDAENAIMWFLSTTGCFEFESLNMAHKPQPLGMAGGGTKASFYGCLLCWVHRLEIFPLLIRGRIHDTCFMCKAAIITGNREPCPCFPLSFRIS